MDEMKAAALTTHHEDVLALLEGELDAQAVPQDGIQKPPRRSDGGAGSAAEYNETLYLIAYPDVAEAVVSGVWEDGLEHYEKHGKAEGRLDKSGYLDGIPSVDSARFPASSIDAAFVSRAGWCLVIGWIHDEPTPLSALAWTVNGEIVASAHRFARCRREDAEAAVGSRAGKLLGFWTIFQAPAGVMRGEAPKLYLWAGTDCRIFQVTPKWVEDLELREMALEYLAASRFFANSQVASIQQLQRGLGKFLINHNMEISKQVTAAVHVMRFGLETTKWDGSIIVCLFGKAEYLFLQLALFSGCPGADRYEYIYVSNSPELAERLIKEAKMATRIYGVAITLVILPANAGFGAANNVASMYARSDRIMIVNPDVFPRDREWASRHSSIVDNLPIDQTSIFGAPLYYDDGSLMHSGMYFDFDETLSIDQHRIEQHYLIRVEHYAKGAPPLSPTFLQSRRVPAVTGAFMSIDRVWFESLGGFSTEYVFGHYEDADLCLKSFDRGQPVWVHNTPFWHLEGKGSVRRAAHEGGSTVNRWYFAETWGDFIFDGFLGRSPERLSGGLAT